MRYMDLGSAKAKKTAVLLHGKNFGGFYWERIAKSLQAKGYRVVIPDQIGFGKSSKPAAYQYSFYNLSYNTFSLLDHLGIQDFILVGHSMGGMLATHMALADASRVRKLILINPIGLEPYGQYAQQKDPEFFFALEMNKSVEDYRSYQKKNYYDGNWQPAYEKLIKPFIGWRNGPDWPLVAWNNALTYLPIFAEDITAQLPRLAVETVLIIGTRDRTGPGRGWLKPGVTRKLGQYQVLGDKACQLIPKCRLHELKGLGHMPQFEDYPRFAAKFNPEF